MQNQPEVQTAAARIKGRLPAEFFQRAPVGVILGTGLFCATGAWDVAARIPFSELPGFPQTSVSSHAGEFILARLGSLPIIFQSGRVHLYEGRTAAEICMGVRVLTELGCQALIITNAAGSLNPLHTVPGLMRICDIINFTGVSPLTGICDASGRSRFADMSRPFDPDLGAIADAAALALGIELPRGIYLGVHGPEMETPAETRMYRKWGADAIGMSTCLEVIAANWLGVRCLGLSCLTNRNLPDCMQPAPIEAVIAAAEKTAQPLSALLQAVLTALADGVATQSQP